MEVASSWHFLYFFFVLFFIYPLQPGTFCNLNRLCAQTQQRSHLKSGPAEEQVLYRVFFCLDCFGLAWFYFDFPPLPIRKRKLCIKCSRAKGAMG